MEDDEAAVARCLHVELDVVRSELDGTLEGRQRVLLLLARRRHGGR